MNFYSGEDFQQLRLQYKDFAQWQYNRLKSGKLTKQEAYWWERFSGELPVLNMPGDFPRPPVQSFEGDRFHFTLEKSLTLDLNRLIKEKGTTLFMVLLAVYNILLARYTGQEDIVIGTTIAGRPHPDLENIIGLLIETLALRNYPKGEQTFGKFLKDVKQGTLEAYDNQDYPFKELIRKIGAENEISRNPVFDAMLIVQNIEVTAFKLEGLKFFPYQPPGKEAKHTSKVDFTIEAVEAREEIYFKLEYCSRLYKRETMERFAQHFINIIKEVVNNPVIQLSVIEVISEEEKRQLLEEFNDTGLEYTSTKMVHELFADQVEETPDNTALVGGNHKLQITNNKHGAPFGQVLNAFGGIHLTYRELNEKSDQLAYVLKEKGVHPDTIVGIMVEPSVGMVIGIIGILKSGGAYLPIDAEYPEERIKYILEDSGTGIILTSASNRFLNFSEVEHFNCQLSIVNCQLSMRSQPATRNPQLVTSLAYIIYTSGTTGRPKGVMVEHQNLTAYINAFEKEFDLQPDDTVIQQASYAFDAFVEELYPILLKGGKLAIPGREVLRDIHVLCCFIARHQVTFITCSPQLLNELNNYPELLTCLRILISGGDRLKAEYIGNLLKIGNVYNTYGPTESTVCATYYRCPRGRGLSANVSIGRPITNYQVYILDKYQELLPVGVVGELCVAGAGVARGYLNNPELTKERYIEIEVEVNKKFLRGGPGAPRRGEPKKAKCFALYAVRHAPCAMLSPPGRRRQKTYRTGDLARWLRDGNIEFLGRIDRQVKIRGYRIELGEIENRLMALENIKKAVVVESERKSGQNYLVAYVVANDQSLEIAEIKGRLACQLPDYMIPSYIMVVAEIPLTLTGKIHWQRLPSPRPHVQADQAYAAPVSNKEKTLTRIWQEVLELDRVGPDDNFFDLGGTSLDIFNLNTKLNKTFKKQIPVVVLFQYTTIRSLLGYLERGTDQQDISHQAQTG
ncbi:MAG: amino acid adenylation domain-containing protein, partial [Candidatus Aminicenantes bacterium]